MAENQEQAKPKEREIPVLTVLKNNCVLKNIFLLDNPPSISTSLPSGSENVDQESEMEEILEMGRHPDCNIKLEHPSISRFHLRIHSKPSSRSLHVTDLSSAHGTWISGKKVEPGVRMKLNEGDTLHLGASSRLYRLSWVPLSRAYDIDNPFVPQLDTEDVIDEETEEALLDQEKGILFDGNDKVESLSDNLEGLEQLFSDEDFGLSLKKMSSIASLVPDDLCNSISKEEIEKNSSPGLFDRNDKVESLSDNLEGIEQLFSDEDFGLSLKKTSSIASLVPNDLCNSISKEETEKNSSPGLFDRNDKVESLSDNLEGLEQLFSDEDFGLSLKKTSSIASLVPNDLCNSISKEEIEKNSSPGLFDRNDKVESLSDNLEGLEQLFSDEDFGLSLKKTSSIASLVPNDLCNSISKEEIEKNSSPGLFDRNDKVESLSDNLEGLEQLFSDEDFGLSLKKTSPIAPLVPDDLCNSISKEEVEKNCSHGLYIQESELCFGQPCQFEKENRTPSAGHLEATEIPGMSSGKNSVLNIWSRRGKSESVRINMSLRVKKSFPGENSKSESVLKYPDNEEENFMSDKENASPDSIFFRSSKGKCDENLENEISPISSVGRDEEIFTPDKENITPSRRLFSSVKKIAAKNPKAQRSSPLKPAYNSSNRLEESEVLCATQAGQNREVFQELKLTNSASKGHGSSMKQSPLKPAYSSSNSQEEAEVLCALQASQNREVFQELKLTNSASKGHGSSMKQSPLKPAYSSSNHQEEEVLCASQASQNREVFQELKLTNSAFKGHGSSMKQSASLKGRANRDPFCSLPLSLTINNKIGSKPMVCEDSMKGSRSIKYPTSKESNTTKVSENKWNIVVDTACLLNKKSRNELQLLRGLRGTSLVIPRIVVRELDYMLKHGGLFTRTSEVSAALQYIEESMAVAKWWIHVQSSAEEERLIPPTPPASSHWFGDDMWASSIGSTPFSPCSLQEIVTPTAGDHILDYALYYKRIRKNGQLVLLTDDVTLKIKAMAEGVLCETAQEFRRSLVNPFSGRFLYSNCSPIGPTWSCGDDVVLKEKYYPSPSKKILPRSGEVGGVKGLKLILMHNSSFRQIKPVS